MSSKAPPPTPKPYMRVLLMALSLIHVLLATGEAYGWTALRPVLYSCGYFDAFSEAERAIKMNLVSTLGISANAMSKLPLGFLLDRCGPRATSVAGSMLFLIGCALMAFGDRQSLTQIALGYFLLGTAGPFIQMPAFQFTNLFPKHKATLISLMITSFELSTGVFFLFNVMNMNFGVSAEYLFSGYMLCGVFTLLTSLFLWPDSPHVEPHQDTSLHQDDDVPTNGPETPELADCPPDETSHAGGAEVPLIERGFWQQISSWEFVYVTLFFSVHNFTQGVVLATMGMQTTHYFTDKHTAVMMANLFSVILPLGFLPMLLCTMTGLSGYIISRPQLAFLVVSLMSCTYGGLFLFPSFGAYIVLFTMFPVARQFVFSTFISFSATTFGYKSFGVINGLASTFAGFAQLLQNGLVILVTDDRNSFSWEDMDILMSLVPTILLVTPTIYFVRQMMSKNSAPGDEDMESQDVTDPLLQGSGHRRRTSAASALSIPEYQPVSAVLSGSGSSVSSQQVPNFGSLDPSYAGMGIFSSSLSGSHQSASGSLLATSALLSDGHPRPTSRPSRTE